MNILKRSGLALLALLLLALALEAGQQAGISRLPSFVAPAAAVVGRPLTPVSYAGVARRTARRCSAGVYNC